MLVSIREFTLNRVNQVDYSRDCGARSQILARVGAWWVPKRKAPDVEVRALSVCVCLIGVYEIGTAGFEPATP
jgi:hypothetical protein